MEDSLCTEYLKMAMRTESPPAGSVYAQIATVLAIRELTTELKVQTLVQKEILYRLDALLDLKRA